MIICADPSPRARICRAHFSQKVEFCAASTKREAPKAGIGLNAAKVNFVRIANIGTNRSEWWLFTLILFTCLISFTIHDFKNDTEQVPLALQIVGFLQTLPAS